MTGGALPSTLSKPWGAGTRGRLSSRVPGATVVTLCLLSLLGRGAWAQERASFLRENDRILILGDSITHNGTYVRMVAQAIRHFHPQAAVEVNGFGVNGVSSDYEFKRSVGDPTLVTLMLGMNNIIHFGYRQRDLTAIVQAYREDLQNKVKGFQEGGADVVLLTPTLTDEAYSRFFWELRGSRECLQVLGRVVRDIARETGAFCLPVQEELEAFQETLPTVQALRPDGVHPSALGQYQIARTFWQHMNFAGRLLKQGEPRQLAPPGKPVAVDVRLPGLFLGPAIALEFSAPEPKTVELTWSLGPARGTETLQVDKVVSWSPRVNPKQLTMAPGDHQQLLLSIAHDEARSVYVLDLSSVPVLHMQDNTVSGTITSATERPEGALVATWKISTHGKGLVLSGEVFDDDIQGRSDWPWGRENVTVWLDLRTGERFAGIGFDEDVYQSIITVREEPLFACSLQPWQGRGMEWAANVGGQKTATGWRWNMLIHHPFFENQRFAVNEHDYIGFNLTVVDEDHSAKGRTKRSFHSYHKAEHEFFIYPNLLVLLDMKNQLEEDRVTTLHLFGR